MDAVMGRKIHPLIIPFYEEVQVEEGLRVGVLSFTQGVSKPYVLRHNDREDIYIRIGSVSRLATREQQARLFATGGMLHTETLPVSGTSIDYLDLMRLQDYLRNVIKDPEIPDTKKDWQQRLCSLNLKTEIEGHPDVCTIAGLVLFGYQPRRYLRQGGFHFVVYEGADKEYKTKLDEILDGPIVAAWHTENKTTAFPVEPFDQYLRMLL